MTVRTPPGRPHRIAAAAGLRAGRPRSRGDGGLTMTPAKPDPAAVSGFDRLLTAAMKATEASDALADAGGPGRR